MDAHARPNCPGKLFCQPYATLRRFNRHTGSDDGINTRLPSSRHNVWPLIGVVLVNMCMRVYKSRHSAPHPSQTSIIR